MDPVYFLSEDLRHDLLEYLRRRPWEDVNNLVVPLMRAEKGLPPKPEPPPTEAPALPHGQRRRRKPSAKAKAKASSK